jgi:phage terminase large subunit
LTPALKAEPGVLNIEVPRAFLPLLKPARYKGAHGGRGGAKSHFFAEQLVKRCWLKSTRAVCIREVQNSLRDSVRQLIIDKIAKFGLEADFEVLESEIRCKRTGSLIIFRGMQHYNAETIKSLEGFDIAWVEEAQTFSETSLQMLRPTIRQEGSEIWFSWNPRTKRDAVDRFLRQEKPASAIVIKVGWRDNPWFPQVLKDEKDHDYAADPLTAAHVWDGEYQVLTKGSYYGNLLAQARADKRITRVPFEPRVPVYTAWDLGMQGCVWFIQHVGLERRVIEFHQNEGKGLGYFAAYVKNKGWAFGGHYLPHDIEAPEISTGRGTEIRLDTLRGHEIGTIRVVNKDRVADGIQAVQSVIPQCWFDETKCEGGIEALQQYEAEWVEEHGVFKKQPLHNWASHPADAFRMYAMGHKGHVKPLKGPADFPQPPGIV